MTDFCDLKHEHVIDSDYFDNNEQFEFQSQLS